MSNRPVHEVRLGRVTATVWVNDGEYGNHYTTSVKRTYRDDAGRFKDSRSFATRDLLQVSQAVQLVHSWLFKRGLLDNRRRPLSQDAECPACEDGVCSALEDKGLDPAAEASGSWNADEMCADFVLDEAA